MPSGFNDASGNQKTTTARLLTKELDRHAKALGEAAGLLTTELTQLKNAKSNIAHEIQSRAGVFAENTLPELTCEEFDTIAEIAHNVQELENEGLAFYRSRIKSESANALRAANESLDNTVTAEGFKDILASSQDIFDAADANAEEKLAALENAQAALKEWEDNTVEDDLVRLDQEVREKGGIELTTDNRAYYEAGSFKALWRGAGNSSYRAVRNALEAYGHGKDGKDAFADLQNFKDKYAQFNSRIEQAQAAFDGAKAEKVKAERTISLLKGLAESVKTEEEMLEAVRQKVIDDLIACPEFVTAMMNHYEEDFPRALPVLITKKQTLDTMIETTAEKQQAATAEHEETVHQHQRMSQLGNEQRVKKDLDKYKADNILTVRGYKTYLREIRGQFAALDIDGFNAARRPLPPIGGPAV